MTDDIIIDGVTMPTPALGGLTIKKEKVWSNNTGRVANGDMVGDLIAIKYTLEITWPMLSRADAAKIDAAISPAFFNVTFTDPGSNSRITKRCYSNTPSYPVFPSALHRALSLMGCPKFPYAVHPSGNPIRRSHSTGVKFRRTPSFSSPSYQNEIILTAFASKVGKGSSGRPKLARKADWFPDFAALRIRRS